MIQKELQLHIEGLTADGKALARQDGFVYFVRNGAPGDVVRARVTKAKRNYAEADVIEVLAPSARRREPKCRYFGTCGGCAWQHVAYETQLQEKQQHVVDAFERIGGFRDLPIEPIVGSEQTYLYRNKMEFSFSRQRWLTQEELSLTGAVAGDFGLGLHVPGRFDKVLDIEECWLQSDPSNGIRNAVRQFCRDKGLSVYSTKTHEGYMRHLVIRQSVRTGQVMVNLVTTTDEPEVMKELCRVLLKLFPQITTFVNNITERKSMVAVGEHENTYHGPGYIMEELGTRRFRISANSFFQTNTRQAERLYEIARGMGNFTQGDFVLDLYCGTGTVAIFISDSVRKVAGIDLAESAINDACLNAELNGVKNCTFLAGDLKERLTRETAWLTEKPSAVIVDPPRSGLHPKVVEKIAALGPGRVVYISCNPATQARDARMFSDRGYVLTCLQPVDMFPQTPHVENVAAFQRG